MDSFTFSWSRPARWALPVGLALIAPLAFAQEATISPVVQKLKYRSVFSQYQGFKEQPVLPWRETNDTVEKIGGWRVYAKETGRPDAADKAADTPDKSELHDPHGRKP